MKVVSIVGARPQFIKMPLLSEELRKHHQEIILHTGQHYDDELSRIFFSDLGIPSPDHNLGVGSATHGAQTGQMLDGIERVLMLEKPDLVILYGDTNSTLAGALAASKLGVTCAHIEAGMRNFDRSKPEEINRIVTDHISDVLFAPTKTAMSNLRHEGLEARAHLVGDATYDVLCRNREIAEERSTVLSRNGLESRGYITATVHKQKNTNNEGRLREIINALTAVHDIVVFPMHPRTRKYLEQYGLLQRACERLKVTKPLGYFDFIKLLSHSRKIVTDSGGVQKEAYSLQVPCITLRETEWVETVQEGWNVVVGVTAVEIVEAIESFEPAAAPRGFLGDGRSFEKVVGVLNALPFA